MHRPGRVVAARFEIQNIAGTGGMGSVYRARDLETGGLVAVKLLHRDEPSSVARFRAEAKVLSELEHPHVVRYLAHGVSESGDVYLVMEWLEGETLTKRLTRGKLTTADALELARTVASAVGAAHARGIVHRDIKPSNILLCENPVGAIKLLDFGIARVSDASLRLTQTGNVLGTPGYMSPEQAKGDGSAIDARADVFSLGCVLFECLTGEPAFSGTNFLAILAKLLMEEAPRVRTRVPELPAGLDDLVYRMLAKDRQRRPADGATVERELDAIAARTSVVPEPSRPRSDRITAGEQRMLALIMATPPGEWDGHPSPFDPRQLAAIRSIASVLGGHAEELVSGAVLVTLTWTGNPTDLATRAARCSLRLRSALPTAYLSLVTGYSESLGAAPVGAIVERAVALVDMPIGAPRRDKGKAPVRIDDVTSALLDGRFELDADGASALLVNVREIDEQARMLLGKPSPFVGRDREVRAIFDMLASSFDEDGGAQTLVVVGPPGSGKSRLRQEISRLVRDARPRMGFVMGRGDSTSAGSAFTLIGSLLRSTVGIVHGEHVVSGREKILELVGRTLAEPHRTRVAEFLGEIVGTPFSDDRSPRLYAARKDAAIMEEGITSAFIDLLRGVVAVRPFLIVLEDLQWGDMASLRLLDTTLRELEDQPLVLLAFSRPEAFDDFPGLWQQRSAHVIRIGALSRRSAEELVRSALGESITTADTARLCERADGNAFFLEELIRAFAEGRGDALPDTVLGMVEARIAALPSEARRLLRAASVFGRVFWKGGVLALLGVDAPNVEATLPSLVERELIIRHNETRFAGEDEYAFRHALLRESAHVTLTDRDRAVGHGLAAEWLIRAGEYDARVLAEHLEIGGQDGRASAHWFSAAEQALRGGDHAAAMALSDRAIRLAGDTSTAAPIRAFQAEVAIWSADYELACRLGEEALSFADPTSAAACRALAATLIGSFFSRKPEVLRDGVARLCVVEPGPETVPTLGWAFGMAMLAICTNGQRAIAEVCLGRLAVISAPYLGRSPAVSAWLSLCRSFWMLYIEGDPGRALAFVEAAQGGFELSGSKHYEEYGKLFIGIDSYLLGAYERAERFLRPIATSGFAAGSARLAGVSLAMTLVARGAWAEGAEIAQALCVEAEAGGDSLAAVRARLVLVSAHLRAGAIELAEQACVALGHVLDPSVRLFFHWHQSARAEVELRKGRLVEALEIADEAIAACDAARLCPPFYYASLIATRAEACLGLGRIEMAKEALAEGREYITIRAANVKDAELRRSFVERVEVHAWILAACAKWLS